MIFIIEMKQEFKHVNSQEQGYQPKKLNEFSLQHHFQISPTIVNINYAINTTNEVMPMFYLFKGEIL